MTKAILKKRTTQTLALTTKTFERGLRVLSRRDPDLARILNDFGKPPMWTRKTGFPTLIHLILEQQVSLASARAAMDRLLGTVSPLTPSGFLKLDDAALKTIGFSRQKAEYCRCLAQYILDSRLKLAALHWMDDATARAELIKIKGIGVWTADNYLLMALRRPDILPTGDLALAVAVQRVKRLKSRPTPDKIVAFGLQWQPWRSVATRLLWHYYLSQKILT